MPQSYTSTVLERLVLDHNVVFQSGFLWLWRICRIPHQVHVTQPNVSGFLLILTKLIQCFVRLEIRNSSSYVLTKPEKRFEDQITEIMQAGFQLALELSNVFPIREAVQVTFDTVVNFARNLQKSGSDIIVEEDLATIFGRGRISLPIEQMFKKDILINHTFVPIHEKCEIGLDTPLGPSISRALQPKDSGYLSTVIQLSMLGWNAEPGISGFGIE